MRDYYAAHRTRIEARRTEKMVCVICGATVTRGFMRRHERTKRCSERRNQLLACPSALQTEIEQRTKHLDELRSLR